MKTLVVLIVVSFLVSFSTISLRKDSTPDFPINAAPLSSPSYDKAMLLLHNFEYEDAAELFIESQKQQPGNAMAYWGEAMTYDHPVWGDLDIDKARAALRRLGATSGERESKCKTELEKDFIRSNEILFGDGSKPDRQRKYAEFMGSLYKKYPGNLEVTAFYCLSLLGDKKGWSEWEDKNIEAARLATEILSVAPEHPGALHYLVHANDHPQHAKDGLDAANKYAVVASYAGHALHMPSHIYLALGMWDDVVRSNEVAWQASVDQKEKKKLSNDEYSYHAYLWLHYGYLQQGRYSKAKEVFDNQLQFTNELPSPAARVHLLQMIGHYLFETDDWSSPVADLQIKTDDIMATSQYNNIMIRAYKAFHSKNTTLLQTIIVEFEKKLSNDEQIQKANENITICGVKRFVNTPPSVQEILAGRKILKRIQGMNAWLIHDFSKADEYFRESLPKEGSVVIGPLFSLISSHELYGRFLLATNKPSEAMEQFGKALLASPNRNISLKGQLKAARQMKDANLEKQLMSQLQKNLANAEKVATKDL